MFEGQIILADRLSALSEENTLWNNLKRENARNVKQTPANVLYPAFHLLLAFVRGSLQKDLLGLNLEYESDYPVQI